MTDSRPLNLGVDGPFRLVQPESGESVHSYMHRLAEAYGVICVQTIMKEVSVGGPRPFSAACMPRLAKLGGVSTDAIATLCAFDPVYAAGSNVWNFGLEDTSHFAGVNCRILPFCPACLQERGVVPAFVHLAAVCVCPLHRCRIVATCPKCHALLRAQRPRLSLCRCRFPLDSVDPIQASSAEQNLACSIYSRIVGSMTSDTVVTSAVGQVNLAALCLDDLVYLHWALGHVLPYPRPSCLGSRRHLSQREGIEAAASCLDVVERPDKVVAYLRAWFQLLSEQRCGEVSLPFGLFRSVLKRLVRMPGIPVISQLISAELHTLSRQHPFRPTIGPKPSAQMNLFEEPQ